MANFNRSMFSRFVASFLSFVLIQTAPGMGAYSALAQVRTAAGTAAGTVNSGAPVRVQMSLPSASAVLTPNVGLGLNPGLSVTNAVPNLVTPSVAVNIDQPNQAAQITAIPSIPLSFKPSTLPAAAKSVAVNAAVPVSAALVETGVSLSRIASEESAPAAEPSALLTTLSRLFDGSSAYKGTLPVPAAASIGDSAPSSLAPSALSAASKTDSQPPVPSNNETPSAPSRSRVSIGLGLAALGGAAAWYTSAWAVAVLGGFLAPFVAVPALVLSASWISLGALAGFAAFSVETWKGFPSDLKNSALSAGAMTFRFWARFGLIFDSVLRGGSTDEAMKKELSANILKYPLIAWLFVLAGYAMSPVAFLLGSAYRLIGTPFLAAFRGAREVIVGFLPWMARVFRFLGRLVVRIFPFAGGLIVGGLKTAFFGAAAGAAVLAGPIGRDAFLTDYKAKTLPGWIGFRLTQVLALAAVVVTGAVGAVIGLLVSPVHVVMGALDLAFDWSGLSPKGEEFFSRWMKAVKNDGGLTALLDRGFPLAAENLTLAARVARVLNGTAISLYTALFLPFVSIATIVRASRAASRGEDTRSPDGTDRKDEKGAETPVAARPGIVLPAVLGVIGAAAGVAAALYFLVAPLVLLDLGLLALAAVIGGGLGLALSQPQAWSGSVSGAISEGSLAAKQSFGGWRDAGARTAAALRGDAVPRASEPVVALAIPTVAGAIAAALSAVIGGVQSAVSTTVSAAWAGFMAVITQFLPALKRFFDWAVEVLKDIVPFVFGFLFGTILGVFKSGWFVASNLFRPVQEIFEREDKNGTERPSEAQIGAGVLMGLTLVVPALAAFAGSFAVGMIAGIPVALTHGVALGVRWAGTGEKSEMYFKNWERRSLPNALKKAAGVVKIKLSGEGVEMPIWRLYVRSASFLLAAIPSTIALVISGGAAYVRSLADAKLAESKPEAAQASTEEPAAAPVEKAAQKPVGKPPVWVAALTGALGLAAGIYAAIVLGPVYLMLLTGWQLWLGYATVFAAVPVLGLSAGLAVSQPVLWTRLIPSVVDHAKAGFGRSLGYWTAAGKAVGLTPVYGFAGGVLGLVWGVAGAAFGLAAAGAVAAYEGARQVVYEILPFLRTAFETLMKVLRRVVPFVFGLFAGLISGVVGSAAFGALLLGRPYFKHVVADDFKHEGALGFLGNLLLKAVAFVLGVVFGLIGVVAGVLAALPYALTASVAFAFRFADIGGPVQKFFDHWTYGALRAELRRLSQLTDRFQFPEGEAALSDGWIRMANVLPATIAAAFAGTIAGWVGFFRSLGVAYKSAKSGGPIPEPVVDQEAQRRWDRTWRSSKKAALSFFAWGVAGAVIGLVLMLATSWTPLGLAGWLLVGALAGAGVLGALALAAVIATVALFLWIDGQLR
jgi:phage-related protein